MDIKVEVGPVTLDTVIGEKRFWDGDAEEYRTDDMTLGDAIAKQVFEDLCREDHYSDLKKTVTRIREEEIRERVRAELDQAMTGPIQETNRYGEPTGNVTTLRELIIAEATKFFGTKVNDPYDRRGESTPAGLVVRKVVQDELTKELLAAVNAEKGKVAAAVKDKAAEIIAETVRQYAGLPK